MSKPVLSVLLPTHYRPEVFACAIAAVLQQSVTNFELQIVGDGCSESTEEVIRSFSDERILWYNRPKDPGFGYANRNNDLWSDTAVRYMVEKSSSQSRTEPAKMRT